MHIGKEQLKLICYLMILPLFLKWSNNATLSIEDVRLRTTNWVELVPLPGVQDVNAIARQFFVPKGKNNIIQFNAGKGAELYLEIEYSKYQSIIRHIDEINNPQVSRAIADSIDIL